MGPVPAIAPSGLRQERMRLGQSTPIDLEAWALTVIDIRVEIPGGTIDVGISVLVPDVRFVMNIVGVGLRFTETQHHR